MIPPCLLLFTYKRSFYGWLQRHFQHDLKVLDGMDTWNVWYIDIQSLDPRACVLNSCQSAWFTVDWIRREWFVLRDISICFLCPMLLWTAQGFSINHQNSERLSPRGLQYLFLAIQPTVHPNMVSTHFVGHTLQFVIHFNKTVSNGCHHIRSFVYVYKALDHKRYL